MLICLAALSSITSRRLRRGLAYSLIRLSRFDAFGRHRLGDEGEGLADGAADPLAPEVTSAILWFNRMVIVASKIKGWRPRQRVKSTGQLNEPRWLLNESRGLCLSNG
jgi:hypothetical protein